MGLCSKCYRESQANEQKNTQEASIAPSAEVATLDTVTLPQPIIESTEARVVEPPTSKVESAIAVEEPSSTSPADEQPEKPVQANKSRCFECKKKVGLLGFECRCGYVYCSSHRHAADHSCTFDYAGFDRERLAKANPLVAASKLDKL